MNFVILGDPKLKRFLESSFSKDIKHSPSVFFTTSLEQHLSADVMADLLKLKLNEDFPALHAYWEQVIRSIYADFSARAPQITLEVIYRHILDIQREFPQDPIQGVNKLKKILFNKDLIRVGKEWLDHFTHFSEHLIEISFKKNDPIFGLEQEMDEIGRVLSAWSNRLNASDSISSQLVFGVIGDQGGGKTKSMKLLANALDPSPLIFDARDPDFVKKLMPDVESKLSEVNFKGNPEVILIDEVDKCDVNALNAITALLDRKAQRGEKLVVILVFNPHANGAQYQKMRKFLKSSEKLDNLFRINKNNLAQEVVNESFSNTEISASARKTFTNRLANHIIYFQSMNEMHEDFFKKSSQRFLDFVLMRLSRELGRELRLSDRLRAHFLEIISRQVESNIRGIEKNLYLSFYSGSGFLSDDHSYRGAYFVDLDVVGQVIFSPIEPQAMPVHLKKDVMHLFLDSMRVEIHERYQAFLKEILTMRQQMTFSPEDEVSVMHWLDLYAHMRDRLDELKYQMEEARYSEDQQKAYTAALKNAKKYDGQPAESVLKKTQKVQLQNNQAIDFFLQAAIAERTALLEGRTQNIMEQKNALKQSTSLLLDQWLSSHVLDWQLNKDFLNDQLALFLINHLTQQVDYHVDDYFRKIQKASVLELDKLKHQKYVLEGMKQLAATAQEKEDWRQLILNHFDDKQSNAFEKSVRELMANSEAIPNVEAMIYWLESELLTINKVLEQKQGPSLKGPTLGIVDCIERLLLKRRPTN